MLRKLSTLVFAVPIVVLLIACAPKPAIPVTFDTYCTGKFDSQRISIQGYLNPTTMIAHSGGTYQVNFYSEPGQQGTQMQVYITEGSGANQMETLPDRFSPSDFHVHTSDNKRLGVDDLVRLTGDLRGFDDVKKHTCYLKSVDTIESVPNP